MTVHQQQVLRTVQATADLSASSSRFKVVTVDGTICSAALQLRAAGISWTSAESGQGLSVAYRGITKAMAGEAVTSAGYPFKIANSGFLVNATSGSTTFGRFAEACSSGDLVAVEINFDTPAINLLA